MKRCNKCGATKPVEDFYRAAGTRDGRRGDCIRCFSAARKARDAANPEANRARARAWRLENAEQYWETKRRYVASGLKAVADRRSYLKRSSGLSLDDYERMLKAQGGRCAICRQPPNPKISFHIDHDHQTGKVRGLLCFTCNNGLGQLQDSPVLLRKAAAYVEAGRG